MSALIGQKHRAEDVWALPGIGLQVVIRAALDCGDEEFQGIIAGHRIDITDRGEELVAEVEHRLAGELSPSMATRWQLSDGQVQEVPSNKIRFNAGDDTLASAAAATLGSRKARVFDSDVGARRWTVADVLGYLIATAVPPQVEAPSLQELERLAGGIDVDSMNLTGLTVGEALIRVSRLGGLEMRSARRGLGLVFYRPGRQGRRRTVRLQPAGEKLSQDKSNLWRGQIHVRRRPSRPGVLALGEHKRYESTFYLAKGWDPSLETSRWRDLVRSESGNWPLVAQVYRKWVLNEHGWYSGSPWYLPTHSFSDISAEDFTLNIPRELLPTLSAGSNGRSLGVVVEVRCGTGASWKRWRGPLWVSRDECAIYFGGDALPADFFQAAVEDEAAARVTATVEADVRLVAEIKGDRGMARQIIDISNRAAWRQVHSDSIFHNADGLGQPGERDDSQLLEHIARRHAEGAALATEAELVLGWVDTSFHVGDIVERVDGRVLELASNLDAKPFLQSVRHDFGPGQTTTLIVSG
ncbi:MAG: hypothetical protein SVT52_02780 [Planctomycetota bacterium]|nr:hypothetical protein [Planctomycetota bacterium]